MTLHRHVRSKEIQACTCCGPLLSAVIPYSHMMSVYVSNARAEPFRHKLTSKVDDSKRWRRCTTGVLTQPARISHRRGTSPIRCSGETYPESYITQVYQYANSTTNPAGSVNCGASVIFGTLDCRSHFCTTKCATQSLEQSFELWVSRLSGHLGEQGYE